MIQESKKFLLQDLCARLPYGVMCNIGLKYPLQLQRVLVNKSDGILLDFYEDGNDYQVYLSEVKPYLRPMEDMTEEEVREFYAVENITPQVGYIHPTRDWHFTIYGIDWLNANHFDYRGLIKRDLAIKVTDKNNPYKS